MSSCAEWAVGMRWAGGSIPVAPMGRRLLGSCVQHYETPAAADEAPQSQPQPAEPGK
jgi:hypothetical protein